MTGQNHAEEHLNIKGGVKLLGERSVMINEQSYRQREVHLPFKPWFESCSPTKPCKTVFFGSA